MLWSIWESKTCPFTFDNKLFRKGWSAPQLAKVKLQGGTYPTFKFVYSACQLVMFCDIKALQRDTKCEGEQAFKKVSWSPGKTYVKKKRGEWELLQHSQKTLVKVCVTLWTFSRRKPVFSYHTSKLGFFFLSLNSHFNPAAILSEALQHSQRHQLDKFLSCDAIWLTKPLVNQLTCLKPPHSWAL